GPSLPCRRGPWWRAASARRLPQERFEALFDEVGSELPERLDLPVDGRELRLNRREGLRVTRLPRASARRLLGARHGRRNPTSEPLGRGLSMRLAEALEDPSDDAEAHLLTER